MEFSFYGHACFSIKVGAHTLLFDPFISPNPLAKEVDSSKIVADFILVSHGHEDHTADLIALAKQTDATIISNYEICTWAEKQGIEKVHPMNFGTATFPFGELTYFQAQHSSSFADGSYAGAAGGFIIKSAQGNFYYSGDTSLMMDMQLVPKYATLDFALLPIGGNFTMNAREAILAANMIDTKKIVGLHFDTFGYIKIDHEETIRTFMEQGLEILLPAIGQTYNL